MTPRVLVVEDEDNARTAIEEYLGLAGYAVCGAADANEGIERGLAFRPDVLLCDYLLPGSRNGTEVVRRLLADLPGLKVLVMTGLPTSEVEPGLAGLPVHAVLTKPLGLARLRAHIDAAVEIGGDEPRDSPTRLG